MDMLVPLYKLAEMEDRVTRMADHGITIRRAMPYEREHIVDWVRQVFTTEGPGWASECGIALSSVPAKCHIATREGQLLGFACFDATAKGVFGPTGSDPGSRGQGIGAALLQVSMAAMQEAGYAYAVIGGAGEHVRQFYQKVAAAVEIEGSEPGMYRDSLSG
jgi:GNAT superfamily N-acetyltransferase